MLQVENVSKKLGSFQLDHVSFSLPKGYIMGLAGANGAGKTSTLKLILGVFDVDDGTIKVDGMSYPQDEMMIKNEIGFVMKENIFWPNMGLLSCADQVGMHYIRYSHEKMESLLTEFGLSTDKKVGKLSEGQKMKFQFAFALAHEPKLLVIDEATGSFDPDFREKMQKKMTDFVSDGEHSILFSSHVTDEMERIADYITMLHDGQIIFSMDRETLLEKYRIVQGPKYKMNLLRKEDIIYVEHTDIGSTALIEYYPQHNHFDANIGARKPTVEEVLYYMMKSKGKDFETWKGGKVW